MIQHREDLQMRRYTDEELRVMARAAVDRLTDAVSLPTTDERLTAVAVLFREAPTFAHHTALTEAAIGILVANGMK